MSRVLVKIRHPSHFFEGTRVLNLTWRKEINGAARRSISRVTHNVKQFEDNLCELDTMLAPGERIYVTAGKRSIPKAMQLFKERQIIAEANNVIDFYEHLESRWASCLNDVRAQEEKIWLLDCDSTESMTMARRELEKHYIGTEPYIYETKQGWHILSPPFSMHKMDPAIRKLLHRNANMLFSYWTE